MKILSFGSSSSINLELSKLGCSIDTVGRKGDFLLDFSEGPNEKYFNKDFLNYTYYIFNAGSLSSTPFLNRDAADINQALNINLVSIVFLIEFILQNNPNARIIVIGSESGKKGSFDKVYHLSKAALSAYCRERYLHFPNQQLLVISPSTIGDAGMTISRTDLARLEAYERAHPKKRFLKMSELALFIFDIFNNPSTYLTNTDIHLDGGKFARSTL